MPMRLDWTLDYSHPPNPCMDGSSLASRSHGLFDPAGAPLLRNPGPPEVTCGANAAGAVLFNVLGDATAIFAAYQGAVRIPEPGPPGLLVYAFPPSIAEGDLPVDTNPGAAPFVLLGSLCGDLFWPEPGPPEFPLFSLREPGHADRDADAGSNRGA